MGADAGLTAKVQSRDRSALLTEDSVLREDLSEVVTFRQNDKTEISQGRECPVQRP